MEEHGLKIKKCSAFTKRGTNILLVVCKIRKNDELKFESVIGNIRNMALLLGYKEYDAMCEQLCNIGGENGNISSGL